jgi:DNA polymerase
MGRDLLVEGILRLEAAGFPVIFSSHDEAIIEVPATNDPKKLADMKHEASALMTQAPAWAPNLPIDVDGGFSPCYTKL